jgi:hypothetical protein
MHALLVQRPGAAPERRDIVGPLRAGGSRADDVLLPDSPPASLRLLPCPAGIVVEAVACGAHVAGHVLHPGARRLLRAGERLELHGSTVVLERRTLPADGTRAAAAALLRAASAGAAHLAGAHLVVLSGPAAGARFAVGREQTLGRGRAATIVLPDAAASRVHARLRLLPNGVAQLEDLGSKNGVRVNGVRIDRRPLPVRAGDEISLGETVLALEGGGRDALETPPGAAAPPDAPGRGHRAPPGRHVVVATLLALSAAALALAAS